MGVPQGRGAQSIPAPCGRARRESPARPPGTIRRGVQLPGHSFASAITETVKGEIHGQGHLCYGGGARHRPWNARHAGQRLTDAWSQRRRGESGHLQDERRHAGPVGSHVPARPVGLSALSPGVAWAGLRVLFGPTSTRLRWPSFRQTSRRRAALRGASFPPQLWLPRQSRFACRRPRRPPFPQPALTATAIKGGRWLVPCRLARWGRSAKCHISEPVNEPVRWRLLRSPGTPCRARTCCGARAQCAPPTRGWPWRA